MNERDGWIDRGKIRFWRKVRTEKIRCVVICIRSLILKLF